MGPLNISLCATYLLEATFVVDRAKFVAGALSAMSAMLLLELPHVNVLSKCDLVSRERGLVGRRELKKFVRGDVEGIMMAMEEEMEEEEVPGGAEATEQEEFTAEKDPAKPENVMKGRSFRRLNRAVAGLIEDFGMVDFLQLDALDEDSVGGILAYIDECIQFHEAQEPREPPELEVEMD